jgi:hypothetical protein
VYVPGVMIGVWYLRIYAGVTVSTITVFSNEPGPVIVTRRTRKLATSSSMVPTCQCRPGAGRIKWRWQSKAPPYSEGDWATRLTDKAHSDRHLLLGDRQWATLLKPGGQLGDYTDSRTRCSCQYRDCSAAWRFSPCPSRDLSVAGSSNLN